MQGPCCGAAVVEDVAAQLHPAGRALGVGRHVPLAQGNVGRGAGDDVVLAVLFGGDEVGIPQVAMAERHPLAEPVESDRSSGELVADLLRFDHHQARAGQLEEGHEADGPGARAEVEEAGGVGLGPGGLEGPHDVIGGEAVSLLGWKRCQSPQSRSRPRRAGARGAPSGPRPVRLPGADCSAGAASSTPRDAPRRSCSTRVSKSMPTASAAMGKLVAVIPGWC